MANIFEAATRRKLRFESAIGLLSVEQLWDLPLTTKNKVDLDGLARGVARELRDLDDGSFVKLTPDPRKAELEVRLEILKHIIAVKMADAEAARKAAETAERKQKLLQALANKQDAALGQMSEAEIRAEIEKLGA